MNLETKIAEDEARFWKVIAASKRGAGGECAAQCENIRQRLTRMDGDEIIAFAIVGHRLTDAAYRADLLGASYLMNDGGSDDAFDYFREWLLLMGENAYNAALENPDSLARLASEDGEYGWLDGVVEKAYKAKTGRDDYYQCLPKEPVAEMTGDVSAWFDDEEIDVDAEKAKRLYPRLWKKFEWEETE